MTGAESSRPDRRRGDIIVVSRLLLLALALLGSLLTTRARAQSERTPDAALEQILTEARARLPAACGRPGIDRLTRILCDKKIRIGARSYYPLFSTFEGETRQGYEIDIAGLIANRLGIDVEFVRVNAANRIAVLGEDNADMTIATMGHNSQRDGQARFIRPHYYLSETSIIGPKETPIHDWRDLAGRTICVTIGNGSNAQIVARGARVMLFDEAGALAERLRDQTCTLAAQDDSFFAYYFTDAAFAGRFSRQLGFAQVPWGMAVARTGSERLARVLDLISQIFHRDGVFLELARTNHIGTPFLEQQQLLWRQPQCNTERGNRDPACVLPALDTALEPTPFAANVDRLEDWIEARTGLSLSLPMLKTAPAWTLFVDGIVNSLILVAGALVATLGFALLIGAALGSHKAALHWPARLVTITMQSSPVVLTLVIAAAFAQALVPYSSTVALVAAIVALGLTNGCNAGQAISEALLTFDTEPQMNGTGDSHLFARAVGRSATQIVAFLVNATKGTPIASFIGAPELLNSLTDITSFSSGRATTYTLLLIFYVLLVMLVVGLCERLRVLLERRLASA